MSQAHDRTEDELTRRHRTAAMVVGGMLALTLALVAIAFAARNFLSRPGDPTLVKLLWVLILIFGLGALPLRRTRFNATRLQDIAALRGISGLLATLQGTTMQLAFIGGAIALMGFILAMLTGEPWDMLRAGGVALVVLLYCYPRKSAWQRMVQEIEQSGDTIAPPAKGTTA
jgi:O-antigen/teichoic acid export membrane protein